MRTALLAVLLLTFLGNGIVAHGEEALNHPLPRLESKYVPLAITFRQEVDRQVEIIEATGSNSPPFASSIRGFQPRNGLILRSEILLCLSMRLQP
jgi:hypothetical protein